MNSATVPIPYSLLRTSYRGNRLRSKPSTENAPTQERPLERALAVQPATAEPRCLADGVEARHRLAVGTQHAALEVRLDAAETLASHRLEPDRHQRTCLRVGYRHELRGAQPVAAPVAQLGDAPHLV